MADDIPNQNNYQDNQNFDIDINKIYSDFIQEIDASRSFASINVQDQKIFDALSKSGSADITTVAGLIKMETTVQESRCHAFFRLIGFPVVSDDKKLYNPGFDIITGSSKKITLQDKIAIATKPITGFNALSIKREGFARSNAVIFSNPTSIDASALALSSGGTKKLRKFASPMEDSHDPKSSGFELEPFDVNVDRQSYTVDTNSLVGGNEIILELYQDSSGAFPTKLPDTRTHIIMPFIVDARIDFSVAPQSRLVAVPFIPDQSFAKTSATEFVKRPLIEKIIRDRFSILDGTSAAGDATNAILDYIKTVPAIQDEELINIVSNKDIYKQSEQAQFIQTINIIRAMMDALVKAKTIINKAQGEYYWVPLPDKTGPEGNSKVQGVFLPTLIDTSLVTSKDAAIILAEAKNIINVQNSQSGTLSEAPDPNSFALSSHTLTFGPDTSASLGDNSTQNLDTLSQVRQKILQDANDALRTIEIIMGEFSGFGLCDIIAVMGALQTMPKNKLFGFLDTDAFNRAVNTLNIQEPELTELAQIDITDAMASLTSTVKDFYNLMDKIYQNIQENNGNS